MLPAATRRLFAHHSSAALAGDAGRVFVTLRLAEEGDRRDLAWLTGRLGEEGLRAVLERHGRRQLSRRSWEFWRRVLDLGPAAEAPGAAASAELWPL